MRLFAGIPLDDPARAYVATAAAALQREGVRARWTPAENWHVTLAFLGDVDDVLGQKSHEQFQLLGRQRVCDRQLLRDRLLTPEPVPGQASLAQTPIAPFSLHLSRIGAFPNSRRPRVLWVGGDEQDPALDATALALRAAFTPLGFTFDDAALAHVTIGRTNGFAPLQAPPLDSAISMPVTRLVLFESVRGRAGVRYVEREVILLDTPS